MEKGPLVDYKKILKKYIDTTSTYQLSPYRYEKLSLSIAVLIQFVHGFAAAKIRDL